MSSFKNARSIHANPLALLALLVIFLALAGCAQRARDASEAADPRWSAIIAAHTVGPVPRKSEIRIVFNQDVVSQDRIGKDEPSLLRRDPKIPGKASFVSPRELVLTPSAELEGGRAYRIELKSNGLKGVPENLSGYVFTVQVQAPEYDVQVNPLRNEFGANGGDHMRLNGEVRTADAEAAERVERILKAEYLHAPLALVWEHDADGRTHRFSAVAARRRQPETITLKWDGDAIGAKNQGERKIGVPALRDFIVTDVSVGDDAAERRIDIHFSDALARNQDLDGLVQLSRGTPRFRIEGNLLRVYVEQQQNVVDGDVTVTVAAGVRNERGGVLAGASQHTVTFVSQKPQLRFVGTGVILPDADTITVPIETVNLRALRVTAFRVYDDNLPQFLQVNALDGQRELNRVGRNLWRKHIRLSAADAKQSQRWQRYSLDVTELMRKYPGSLIRLEVTFSRNDIVYDCPGMDANDAQLEAPPKDADSDQDPDFSYWNYWDEQYADETVDWNERDNPCKRAFYSYNREIKATRNLLVSNIGLIAKRDQLGKLTVVATDLRTSQPIANAQINAVNFQNQSVGAAATAGNGIAEIKPSGAPYLVVAEKNGQKGYLRVAPGVALPVSHFDVGGEKVESGVKATLYGERGVWRPGDDIYLTLALQDQNKSIPSNHPVKLELFDPRNQLAQTLVNDKPVGGFYAFALKTKEDAPTGEWTAKATLGGNTFTKTLRVETVMPNRLKMDLQLTGGGDAVIDASKALRGTLASQWLTGARAGNLHADVAVRMNKAATKFSRFADYVFDDPGRDFSNEPQTVFDGALDEEGRARFDQLLRFDKKAPGMMHATFVTRVFEPSGAFSIQRDTKTLSPYANYVGIRLPKGDAARNMLLTDKPQMVEIASVSADGKPVSLDNIELTVYEIEWRWWWDQSGDSFAQFANATQVRNAIEGKTVTANGAGQWTFTIKYPEWGRYLIRACDTVGGHCAAQAFYIDWPAWAGRPQDQSGPGANVLAITADKSEYRVGDVAKVDLPAGANGRALLTVENGSKVLDAKWIDVNDQTRRVDLPLTAAMSPNVYVNVTLIQPHSGKNNDRPLRMYGIVPLKVSDPKTHLQPQLTVPVEWAPESKASIKVSESQGRVMNYTLAVVDEGLLGLTNFKTPNLHEYFYKREALGVSTWDLFDQVAGAYSADLERLLALGGSDASSTDPDKNKSRFPPVVKFLGPFQLGAGKTAAHELTLPKYVGAVRVMLVAGADAAYGSAEKSVFVRQPLMILPTAPRVVGPGEEVALPVSVFTMDDGIRQVDVSVEGDAYFVVQGAGNQSLQFKSSGEQLALLTMKTALRAGQGKLKFTAVSGKHRATAEINLAVRSPNAPSIQSEMKAVQPGETWTTTIKPHGLIGTNSASLEVTGLPPLNLEKRLMYLIQYPHGCLEQTTSGAFPQLYLSSILALSASRKQEVERNINGGIDRLRLFQQAHGGFAYWPGDQVGYAQQSNFDPRASWTTNYAGHFLLEAERLGYHVPAAMRAGWLGYQHTAARSWLPLAGNGNHSLDQAYRLYTLALANEPEMAAMNRLRETSNLPLVARWLLAAAYQVAGMSDAARALTQSYRAPEKSAFNDYRYPDELFGSRLRDQSLVLLAMTSMSAVESAQTLMRAISEDLNAETWYSTHTTAYGLLAMSKFVTNHFVGNDSAVYNFEWQFGGQKRLERSDLPVFTAALGALPDNGGSLTFVNRSKGTLFARVISRGVAPQGDSTASESGLALDVEYTDGKGERIDVSKLSSGTDLVARITVRNNEPFEVKNIALTQLTPAGWEIMNDRMDAVQTAGARNDPNERYRNDWYYSLYTRAREKTEYLDIRDDRVHRYFALAAGERITFVTRLNASYLGKFWLPGAQVEAMYDAARNARSAGQWVVVSERGK